VSEWVADRLQIDCARRAMEEWEDTVDDRRHSQFDCNLGSQEKWVGMVRRCFVGGGLVGRKRGRGIGEHKYRLGRPL